MNTHLTLPVAFILYLNIMIDGFQSKNSKNEVTVTEHIRTKISRKLILAYRQLELHTDSPHYNVAVREMEYLAKEAVENEEKLEKKLHDKSSKLRSVETELFFANRDKLMYVSLIDMKWVAVNFISECYPPWIPVSNNDLKLDAENLRTVLLNIENPRVLRLQRILIENNIPESKFIRDLMRYMSMSDDKPRLLISSTERKRAYGELGEQFESVSDKVILKFLLGDKPDLEPDTESLSTTSPEMSEDAIRRTKNIIRAGFRLVVIPDYVEETDDSELTTDIKAFCDTYGSSIQKSVEESNYKPVAICVVEGLHHAYILFKNFEGAYALWTRRFNTPIPDKFRKAMFLKNVTEEAPLEGDFFLKIETKNENFNDFKTKILKGYDNRRPNCRKDNKESTQSALMFCQFNSFEDMLLVYQYWKEEFRKEIGAADITFSAVRGTDTIKKIPFLMED
ncbi:uncharacterized protein LOC135846172 [Planococcus citri]|uniref:uncharacterized protein LOC135846172 n=1 Tax=Planococcus citri TaxID=170843 RepID=UPI0031F8AA5C